MGAVQTADWWVLLQIASEGLKGRVFDVSLADLQKVCSTLLGLPACKLWVVVLLVA